MRRNYRKKDLPVADIRRYLEPGPTVLVSSRWKEETNIMTMGWHTVMEFSPSMIGCMITAANYSFDMIRKSGECVINIPTYDMIDTIIGIGNSTGAEVDKFEEYGLTQVVAEKVQAPLIKECYANFECKVIDKQLLSRYNFFVLEVVKAHVAVAPKFPRTVHYRGDATFMVAGKNVSYPGKFKAQNL
ncbi:flavin reductase family protein [Chitinophaga rhizophila]|uniref:Flavin reductase family protein n=1 Tax=Chitinophaga rhizophila TaxID=2866212 RepID=A0ABS7GDR6_9BACT|nr:flavin reductase family protein [Chitinophaga rhizophila]MBW8685566.1 flavin reductase family protein [Chitinophaga rhizophila]